MINNDYKDELEYWEEIVKENPNEYAYIRERWSKETCELVPITYEAVMEVIRRSRPEDISMHYIEEAYEDSNAFDNLSYDLGFVAPEYEDYDIRCYPNTTIELNDEEGYQGEVEVFLLDMWPIAEDRTERDKERFDAIRRKNPITLSDFDLHDLHTLYNKVIGK